MVSGPDNNKKTVAQSGAPALSSQRMLAMKIGERLKIGRNDISITDKRVSRQHCVVGRDERGFFVVDTRSTNGTFVKTALGFLKALENEPVYLDGENEVRLGAPDGPAIRVPSPDESPLDGSCVESSVSNASNSKPLPSPNPPPQPSQHWSEQMRLIFEEGHGSGGSDENVGRNHSSASPFRQIEMRVASMYVQFGYDLADCQHLVIDKVLRDIKENLRIRIGSGAAGPYFVSGSAHYYYAREKLGIPDELILVDSEYGVVSMAELRARFTASRAD